MEISYMTLYQRIAGGRRLRGGAPLLALGLAASLAGCGGLLTVDNPNNIKAADTKQPVAATYLANGALAAVSSGYGYTLAPYSVATDELDWSGSRDAWRQLDQGTITDPYNEFSDAAFPLMAQARWVADYAVATLDSLDQAGALTNRTDLARAYLYDAMAYVIIADMYDNFVFSNLDSAGSPIGHDQMGTLYDTAVGYTDKGLAVAGIDPELQIELTAMRARAQFDHAVWNLTGPRPITMGLVSASDGATAATTANAALALMTAASKNDWLFQFTYSPTTQYNEYAGEVADRQEMRLGHAYVFENASKPTWQDSTVLMDPVDSIPDPVINAYQEAFKGNLYFSSTFLSAREMHLIVAEAALAGGDNTTFQNEINAVRGMTGVSDWTPASGISAMAILEYERRVNLFGQGRRLQDEYRFGDYPDLWQPGSEALTTPGRLLPITSVECLSNPNIGADKCATLDP
jgi:starch-binding outer membrane protein, SusD/RagB family